jgi:ADP-ribosylglycohydrolase
MSKITAEQVKSVLLGVAVGDALGVPAEFQQRGSFEITDMTGFGTHNQPAGTWSDDTSLTLCLADAMAGGFTGYRLLEKTADNFVRWFEKAEFTAHGKVFDIGISTNRAILKLKQGVRPTDSGCADVSENGNGSLMRIAPLVFHVMGKPQEERFEIERRVSAITHAHHISVIACIAYVEYLLKLLQGENEIVAFEAVQEEITKAFDTGHWSREQQDAQSRFVRLLLPGTKIYRLAEKEIKSGGYVVDTLEAALWCFLTTDTYRDAVLKAVNLGEDTDTTAAVTGGLAGLCYGTEGIPPEWASALARLEDIKDLGQRMALAIAEVEQP